MEADLVRTADPARILAPARTYPGPAAWVAVLVAVIYLALLPLVERTWRATGDEPHYLLAAHSLVADGDFDLTNNYDRLDYLAFYLSQDIERQVRLDLAGRQFLNHHPGLPVLIAPAYALAGRAGVLAFQALLGGVLAGLTFKLAALVSGDRRAASVSTLFVAISPPLLFYNYLVYPELAGALLTTGLLYAAVRDGRPAPLGVGLCCLALALLPWLNRRFVPLAIGLAFLLAWSWRYRAVQPGGEVDRRNGRGELATGEPGGGLSGPAGRAMLNAWRPYFFSVASPMAVVLSLVLLAWFNLGLSQPARVDIRPVTETALLGERLGRGVGWLVDQQRGLFIFGPVYLLAAWGLPWLFSGNFHRRRWFVVIPVLLALGTAAAAGGYWVAWEVGPRFVVVGLPALASLLALAWRIYSRSRLWRALALGLFGVSLLNGLVIALNPELPYKSSLPLYYGQKLGLPLSQLLPDLAGFTRLTAATGADQARQVTDLGQAALFVPAGASLVLLDSGPLHELPFGRYRLSWPLRVEPGLPPETELLRISVKTLGGGQVFSRLVTAADLPADGHYGRFLAGFANPNVDRWRTPLILQAVSSGRSSIWAGELTLSPDPFYAWVLPYLFLTVAGLAGLLAWRRSSPLHPGPAGQASDPAWLLQRPAPLLNGRGSARPLWLWAVLAAVLALALGHLLYQYNRSGRVYDAREFQHYVGRPVADPAAADGWAWLVDPAVDPPQKAIYGPFDFYDAGLYRVSFRLKLPEGAATDQALARLQVNATANFEELASQPLVASSFARTGSYHDFVLTVDNPRRQALSFDVVYLALAPLMIDQVSIIKMR